MRIRLADAVRGLDREILDEIHCLLEEIDLWEAEPIGSLPFEPIEPGDFIPVERGIYDEILLHCSASIGYDDEGQLVSRDNWLYEDVEKASQDEHAPYHAQERGRTSSVHGIHWSRPVDFTAV